MLDNLDATNALRPLLARNGPGPLAGCAAEFESWEALCVPNACFAIALATVAAMTKGLRPQVLTL